MNFNIYNTLIIAGIIQGFVFTGIVCFAKKYHSKSTFFLVGLIFSYSISNLIYTLPDIGVISLLDMYSYLFIPFASLIAPIIYFYVIYFLNPYKKITLKEKSLFSPFILFFAAILFFRLKIIFGHYNIDPLNPNFKFTILFHELFAVLYSVILLLATFYHIHQYEKKHKTFNIKIIRPDIKWLKRTLSAILFFTLLWGYLAIRNIFFTNGETIFYSLWISMAALIYWLGHYGIYKYGINAQRKNIRDIVVKTAYIISTSKSKNVHIKDLENFLIKEKAYLDSKITLSSVAEHLGLSTSYLSRIIHLELNTSFTDYIHELRVKEAKIYLLNPEFSDYTMTSVGLEAGFNSKSAFYEVFKKTTGETPKAYKKDKLMA